MFAMYDSTSSPYMLMFSSTYTCHEQADLFDACAQTNVNGPKSDPLFMWLKTTTPGSKGELKWNFSKFLVRT
jgi:glutathione peroxidase-family protein